MSPPLKLEYPDDLPVSRERVRICTALHQHQVVIVCGDTGSGKTTQLPKMVAEVLGEQVKGKIAVTQPRRLAATRMAARVAKECGTSLGQEVGVRIRFDDRTSRNTRIQFMTDGLLLAQLPGDPDWREYSAIIIDEAHERSLNIDFLLGCLHDLLPRRPDLKVILSSATLDAERFSEFFRQAPVLEVAGRLYPIRDEFLPETNRDRPISDRVMDALDHLDRLEADLDTLVFLPGEREIRETQQKLTGGWKAGVEVLPLYSRLGGQDQDKAFRTTGKRRIILATNVAETSVTIPGIRAVIDTGEVRLQRFHPQTGIQRLVTETVSQASAKQRRGRCGRTGPGICVRLYSEEDLENAPPYLDPEIRRASLAEVILRMAVLGLPPLNQFPLLDPPKGAAIQQGYRTLMDIGAMTKTRSLTPRGKVLSTFPLDPRLARMLEEGNEEHILAAVIVVVAFLSIQDPRERPAEKTEAADKAHAAWRDPESDFLGHLLLWNAVMSQPSQSKRNRFCRSHFLHPGRVREWINLVDDLRSTCQDHRWEIPASIGEMEVLDPEGLHRSLLAGVPRLVGQREEKREFRGPTGQLFQVFPGSALASKPPKWIMSFSLVETSRIWARECARLQPEWLERVAPHLCKAHYERPVWNEKRGFVEAEERLQFGQLTLRHGTRVHYGRIDPAEARRIFIEDGLCPARLPLQDNVLAPYRAFLNSLQHWENKLRRPGAFTESSALAAHVDRILPKDIFTAKAFGRWSRNVDWIPSPNDLLQVESLDPEGLPDTLQVGGVMVGLDYAVAPENPEVDGVTFVVRDTDLPQVPSELVEWTAPAWLAEKTEGLIRSLEKRLRNRCHPISATASEALAWMKEEGFLFTHSMTGALAAFLAARLDCILAAPDLNPEALPPHLRSRLRVVNAEGSVIYEGGSSPDRSRIEREQTDPHDGDSLTGWEGRWQDWPPGELPPQVDSPQGRRFPAVTCSWPDLVVRLYRSEAEAQDAALTALTAYFRQKYPDPVRYLQKQFPLSTHLQLSLSLEKAVGDSALEDVQNAVLRQALSDGGPAPRSHEDAIQRCDHARSVLFEVAERICQQLELVFTLRSGVQEKIASLSPGPLRTDLEFQQQLMWRAGWCMDPVCLERYPSYLKGIEVRIERALRNPAKDLQKFREMEPALDAFAGIADQCTPAQTGAALLQLEELRLALFSPEIKTSGKASPQRFLRWLENL